LSTNPVVTTAQTAILNNRLQSLSIRFTNYENTNNSQIDEEEETQPHRNSSAFMNKIIEDDETSDDENEDFLYRQNLFSGYEEDLNPENTESISENEIENLINTIDLEEWYRIEKESNENLDNKSESSIQTY